MLYCVMHVPVVGTHVVMATVAPLLVRTWPRSIMYAAPGNALVPAVVPETAPEQPWLDVQPLVPVEAGLQDMDDVNPNCITAPCAGYVPQAAHVLMVAPVMMENEPAAHADVHCWVAAPVVEPYTPVRHAVHDEMD